MKRFKRKGHVSSLTDILKDFLFKLPQGDRYKVYYLREKWGSLLSPEISRVTCPDSLKDGLLIINTKTHEWASELNMLKGKILEQLKCNLEGTGVRIRAVSFKQGTVQFAGENTL